MKHIRHKYALCAFIIGLFLTFSHASHAATRTVDTLADSTTLTACAAATANDCSLRGAISGAAAGDTINFNATLFATPQTIALTLGQITINKNLTITGPGAATLNIQSTGAASTLRRIFNITAGTVNINNLTISGGNLTGDGGGIQNVAALTLTRCIVRNNTASGFGGGIENSGTLTITDSTISNNTSTNTGGNGGGIDTFGGVVTITNTTISGNAVTGNSTNNNAGGIGIYTGSTATITNSTITNNFIVNGSVESAGGVFGAATLRNTIVAGNVNNTTFPDVSSNISTASTGNNLIGSTTNPNFVNGANGNQVGTLAAPLNPRLSTLGNYGGGILTHALLNVGTPSTAINAGNSVGSPAADARGAARVATTDIGAFEVNTAYVAQLPNGRVTSAYNQTITPDNGAFTYSLASGTLPPGLTLQTGVPPIIEEIAKTNDDSPSFAPQVARVSLTGTPTMAGTYTFALNLNNGVSSTTINYTVTILAAPTAASVSIGGQVLSGKQGVANAIIYLTDVHGNTWTTRTTSFGYYRFDDIEVGQTVTVQVSARRYTFIPQIISVDEYVGDLNFIAQ